MGGCELVQQLHQRGYLVTAYQRGVPFNRRSEGSTRAIASPIWPWSSVTIIHHNIHSLVRGTSQHTCSKYPPKQREFHFRAKTLVIAAVGGVNKHYSLLPSQILTVNWAREPSSLRDIQSLIVDELFVVNISALSINYLLNLADTTRCFHHTHRRDII